MYFSAIFDPANFAAVGAYGLILGGLGVLIGVLGFGFTIYQVLKIKGSAAAAIEATERLKSLLVRFEVVEECAKGETELAEIRRCLVEPGQSVAIKNVSALGVCLVRIKDGAPWLSRETQARLLTGLKSVTLWEQAYSDSSGKHGAASPAKQFKTLRDYEGLFVKIRTEAQQEHLA